MPSAMSVLALIFMSVLSVSHAKEFAMEVAAGCEASEKLVKGWWDTTTTAEQYALSSDQIESAMSFVDQRLRPQPEYLKDLRSSLEKDFVTVYPDFVAKAGSDCPSYRKEVSLALINSAVKDQNLRPRVQEKIKRFLTAEPYPTLLNVALDGIVFEYALKKGLWSAGENTLSEVEATRREIRTETENFRKKFDPVFERVIGPGQDLSETSLKNLASKEDLRKLRDAALHEISVAKKYRQRFNKIVSQIP